jgi:3-deoxy-D-manno-octulosonate 8-phosphate phosphatase (KDO 8-P phosphatase)
MTTPLLDTPPLLPLVHPDMSRIRLLCCDVDGVLTDGGLYYGPDGAVMTRFHVHDGQGLKRMRSSGISTCFVTMSNTAAIRRRAQDLNINHCLVGIEDKLTAVESLVIRLGLNWNEVAHIADDINDLGVLQRVGLAVAVPNAVPEVLRACDFVTRRAGGTGAVRELCDALVASRRGV